MIYPHASIFTGIHYVKAVNSRYRVPVNYTTITIKNSHLEQSLYLSKTGKDIKVRNGWIYNNSYREAVALLKKYYKARLFSEAEKREIPPYRQAAKFFAIERKPKATKGKE